MEAADCNIKFSNNFYIFVYYNFISTKKKIFLILNIETYYSLFKPRLVIRIWNVS